MFLSQLFLDTRSQKVHHDLANRDAMHRTVMSFFPRYPGKNGNAREDLGVLFRVDENREGRVVLLIQSAIKPDWMNIVPGYVTEPPACKELDGLVNRITNGTIGRFRILANPIVKHGKTVPAELGGGKTVPITDEIGQANWLARKGKDIGISIRSRDIDVDGTIATLRDLVVTQSGHVHVERKTPNRGTSERNVISFLATLFEGMATVTDAARFITAIKKGIGTGKAFGLGMISFVPVH